MPLRWRGRLAVWWNYFLLIEIVLYFLPLSLPDLLSEEIKTLLMDYFQLWSIVAESISGKRYALDPLYGFPDTPFYLFFYLATMLIAVILATCCTFIPKVNTSKVSWWWHNILRLCLANWMISYGIMKIIPSQVQPFNTVELLIRNCEKIPRMFVFDQLAFSSPYEMLLGSIEVIGGCLLLFPRFMIFGGFISLIAMIIIAIYNTLFDIDWIIVTPMMCCYQVILLWPTIKNISLYLLDKQDLIRKPRVPIIRLPSIRTRNMAIALYCLGIVACISYQFTSTYDIYLRKTDHHRAYVTGVWEATAIEPQLSCRKWQLIAITDVYRGNKVEIGIFDSLEMRFHLYGILDHDKGQIIARPQYDFYTYLKNIDAGKITKITYTAEAVNVLQDEKQAIFHIYTGGSEHPQCIIHAIRHVIAQPHAQGPHFWR